jgi:nitrate/nitrite transporter NarK
MATSLLLHFQAICITYIYTSLYSQSPGASPYTAFQISAFLNAATFWGRFVMGALSDKIGHSNTIIITVVISAVIAFSWQVVSSVSGVFVWVVFYG